MITLGWIAVQAVVILVLWAAFKAPLRRRPKPRHKKEPHQHTLVYRGTTGGGWTLVHCADPNCNYSDIT